MKLRTALLGGIGSILIAALAAQAQVPGVNSTLASVFTLAYDNSTMKPTYSATAILSPAATANDVCLLRGSATKTLKVRRVIVGGVASAAVSEPVSIIKHSSAPVGGTTTVMTAVPYDSASSAATGLADIYTANATSPGVVVGALADVYLQFGVTTASFPAYAYTFGELGSPAVLRGVAQTLAVNLGGGTKPTGLLLSCTFEWTEDNDS